MQPLGTTERDFPLHTLASAPAAAKPALEWYQQQFGMVPHLAGVLAESPALLLSYWGTQLNLSQHGQLARHETNIVQTVVAHANRCQYCVAGHTAFGKTPFFGNTDGQLEAIRRDLDFAEPKLNALRDFTLLVLENQGRLSSSQLAKFLDAGYTRSHALEIVACIAAKVMSNFANQLALTPLDAAFAPLAADLPYHEGRRLIAQG